MYGCESWTIKKAGHQRIDALELWCWRRLLRVPWTARRSNQSPKADQSWVFIGRTDAEAETAVLWPPDGKRWLTGKDTVGGVVGDRGWDGRQHHLVSRAFAFRDFHFPFFSHMGALSQILRVISVPCEDRGSHAPLSICLFVCFGILWGVALATGVWDRKWRSELSHKRSILRTRWAEEAGARSRPLAARAESAVWGSVWSVTRPCRRWVGASCRFAGLAKRCLAWSPWRWCDLKGYISRRIVASPLFNAQLVLSSFTRWSLSCLPCFILFF